VSGPGLGVRAPNPGAPRPTDERLRAVFDLVEPYIERRYGVPVTISAVPNPFTGDLDGAEIKVDHDQEIESAVFIIAHLFGHTVQWNTSPKAREIGYRLYVDATEEELAALVEYELVACRYSIQLFHEAGVHDLDQWLSDFSACDLAYLLHFYRTAEKRPMMSFWQDGTPRLEPLPIPEFTPQKWVARWEGIVV
jgi:hypothetical protein